MQDVQFASISIIAIVGLSLAFSLMYSLFVVPFLLQRNSKTEANPEVVSISLDDATLPEAVKCYFREVIETLSAAGFEVVGGVLWPNDNPNRKNYAMLFANRITRDIALAFVRFVGELSSGRLNNSHVEFSARFRDGTLVQTNDITEIGALRRPPGVYTTHLPSIKDLCLLFRVHSMLANRQGAITDKNLRIDEDFDGDARACISCGSREELERQITVGYRYLEENESIVRWTWKGAIVLSWALTFPFKQIGSVRRYFAARLLLSKLKGN
jgi:hypothetical protein